ncbi:MAG: YhdT family protein [Clostridia bacterium]|nr:YhdT family protein [Clostridia bacterium]
MKPTTREEKNQQVRKEAKATVILFVICFLWHVGFGYGLSGVPIYVCNLPLWWIVSTPGVFVVGVVGVIFLLKKVFVNFVLDEEGGDINDR